MATPSCLDYALHYISRFPKTERELKIQLMQKGYFSADIDKAMEFLKSKEYINDTKFAESYLRSECINKGKPLIRVISKLYEKGIDKHIISAVTRESEIETEEGIHQRIKKEIAAYKKRGEEGFDIIQKLMRK